MIDKLKNFVQRAMNLPKTVAFIQIGNSRKGTAKLKRQKALFEFFGSKVEWYYFDNEINACDLIFEIENLKPFVDKIITYPSGAVQEQYSKNYRKIIRDWKEEKENGIRQGGSSAINI